MRAPSHRTVVWAAVGFIVCVAIGWAFAPAEWSLIDDPGLRHDVMVAVHQHGILAGTLHRIGQLIREGPSWGEFRPAFWVYGAVFYLLPPVAAHAVRGAMFAFVLVAPLVYISRSPARTGKLLGVGALLMVANLQLFECLSFLSLQELSGLVFVAAGLLTPDPRARTALWWVAALFKAPFAWLLVAWGALLLLERRTRTGAAALGLGLATVVSAYIFARHGSYTAGRFSPTPGHAVSAVKGFARAVAPAAVIAICALVATRTRPLSAVRRADSTARALFAGGSLYLATLLPWGTAGGYYASPIVWMGSVSVLLAIAGSAEDEAGFAPRGAVTRWNAAAVAVAFAASAAVGLFVVIHMSAREYGRLQSVAGVRNWLISLDGQDVTVATNGMEVATRFEEIVQFHDPRWNGRIVYSTDPSSVSAAYFIEDIDEGTLPVEGKLIRQWPRARVYRM